MRSIYIHIPFCNTICSYCDFPKMIAKNSTKEEYIDNLIEEIKKYNVNEDIKSVYIGGGTPNALNLSLLERLFDSIKIFLYKSKENTIELNCELINEDLVKLLKKYNFNRVSLGVQTFDHQIIENIKRHHNKKMVMFSIDLLHKYNIQNINLDMIYGLPGQTLPSLEEDIETILSLNIKHLSYYSLILEEKTLLDYQIKHHQMSIPDDDLVADMAVLINQKLKMSMLKQYETSNYAVPGYESIHNLGYWNCEEYYGFGAGAAGYINNIRYTNNYVLNKYYQNNILESEYIDQNSAKKEFMMLGLRKTNGVSITKYYQKFGSYPEVDFNLSDLYDQKLIEKCGDFIKIVDDKILLSNYVFRKFVD